MSIVSVTPVGATAPPSDGHTEDKEESGFWYELRDAQDQTLYRRVIRNPLKRAYEIRTGEKDRPLEWQPAAEIRGTFVLLVPQLKEMTSLVLFSSPLEPARMREPATELSRLNLAGLDAKER